MMRGDFMGELKIRI